MKYTHAIFLGVMILTLMLAVPSYATPSDDIAVCKDWDGTCPAGSEKRHFTDLSPCSDNDCDEFDCCGKRCDSFHGECPSGAIKRGEHDGHMFWGSEDPQHECCVRRCFDNFHGTCPPGKSVRPEWDFHNCGENCASPEECCQDTPMYCKDWNGTCPMGTLRRHEKDMHQCDNGHCDESECCGKTCRQFDGECDAGYERRHYDDGHRFYSHSNEKDECCVKRCFNNFHGECPHNMSVRSEHDWHNCGDNCDSPQECCVETEHDCASWGGSCPAGEEKFPAGHGRTFRDWSGTGKDSAQHNCCGKKCSSDFRTCPAGTQKRPETHEVFYKPGEENSYTDNCCVAKCSDNFHGTCPSGTRVRHEDDWHSCRKSYKDDCQDPADCCRGYCEDNFHGTCPTGTILHPFETCIEGDGHNECNEERCCRGPEKCPAEINAPEGTFMTCMKTPAGCTDLEQYTCPGGCFHDCAAKGKNKNFLFGYANMMGCDTTSWCGGTFNGGYFGNERQTCRSGSCCGRGTVLKYGRCVVDYSSSVAACKEGGGNGAFKCISSREDSERCNK